MFNFRYITKDDTLRNSASAQDRLLVEFIDLSTRSDTSAAKLEKRLLTSLTLAMRRNNRSC